jgi:hypothetical protein
MRRAVLECLSLIASASAPVRSELFTLGVKLAIGKMARPFSKQAEW